MVLANAPTRLAHSSHLLRDRRFGSGFAPNNPQLDYGSKRLRHYASLEFRSATDNSNVGQ